MKFQLYLCRINDISPVKIASLKCVDKRFGSGNVCDYRNVVYIAKSEEIHIIRFVWLH